MMSGWDSIQSSRRCSRSISATLTLRKPSPRTAHKPIDSAIDSLFAARAQGPQLAPGVAKRIAPANKSGDKEGLMSSVHQVFESIARCPNVDRCLGGDASHPCNRIVLSQHAATMADFQLPEPWRGQIDKARIVFVGSNPSIGEDRYALG